MCLPLFILSLTSPVFNSKFLSTSFNKLDFPTPDGPAKTTVFSFNSSFILSIFNLSLLLTGITLYPLTSYILFNSSKSSPSASKSTLVNTITISKFSFSAKTINLSNSDKFGAGFFIANTIKALSTFAIGGLTSSVSLFSISSTTPFCFLHQLHLY